MKLNEAQASAIAQIEQFIADSTSDAFILSGSAGTGKTTLIGALLRRVDELGHSATLLAPTGRAARILSNKLRATGRAERTLTIHGCLYPSSSVQIFDQAESSNDPGLRFVFPLRTDESATSIIIVDEASMVGDRDSPQDFLKFGSGRLLSDLVTFTRSKRAGRDAQGAVKLIFIGDPAQLPPVAEDLSPAMSPAYLAKEFGITSTTCALTQVMRQAEGSAILDSATRLRDAIETQHFNSFSIGGVDDEIRKVDPTAAIDLMIDAWRDRASVVALTPTNALASDYNRSMRHRIWGDPDAGIAVSDVLLINRNHPITGLSNGDIVQVKAVKKVDRSVAVSLRGGHSVRLTFQLLDLSYRNHADEEVKIETWVIENLLFSQQRELSPLEQRALLVDFRKRNPGLKPNTPEFGQALKFDPFFNALNVKFGYALTCHKAQGGEWDVAIVDFGAAGGRRSAAFFRWAYTAITRAAKQLVVVNAPEFSATSDLVASTRTAVAALPDGGESTDPDWDRFSFTPSIQALFSVHRALRTAWNERGIAIRQVQHLQYCERYHIFRDGVSAVIQYSYNGKFEARPPQVALGSNSNEALSRDALSSLPPMVGIASGPTAPDFVREFLEWLDERLGGSSLTLAGHKLMPYRLRVSVTDGGRRGEIDFTHNASGNWTGALEVGGPGTSHGIFDRVQGLLQGQP